MSSRFWPRWISSTRASGTRWHCQLYSALWGWTRMVYRLECRWESESSFSAAISDVENNVSILILSFNCVLLGLLDGSHWGKSSFDEYMKIVWNTYFHAKFWLKLITNKTCDLQRNKIFEFQVIGNPYSDRLLVAAAQDLEEGFNGWQPAKNL